MNAAIFYRHYLHHSNCNLLLQTATKCFRSQTAKKPQKLNLLSKCAGLSGMITGGAVVKIILNDNVLCHAKNTRLVGLQKLPTKNLGFQWKQFWKYLKPHLLNFILAIAVSY